MPRRAYLMFVGLCAPITPRSTGSATRRSRATIRSCRRLTGTDAPKPEDAHDVTRLRTFYASCMAGGDASAHTLQTWLAVIDGIRARGDVQPVLRKLHQAGFAILFQYAGKPDPAVRTRFRGQIDQGTFGARRIYLDQAPRSTRSAPRTPRGSSPCSRGPVRRPTRTPCSTSRASSPARRAMVGHAAGDPLHV